MKLLIIEDDENILSLLKRNFEEDGFTFDTALNGEDGEYLAITNHYDVIIIDWMLPEKNGVEIINSLRKQNISTPIIMLTAKSTLENKIEGIKTGADDYLTKPFDYEELLVRIEALYRRSVSNGNNLIKIKNLTIDIDLKEVKKDNKIIKLSKKEYELLMFFVQNKNSYVTSDMIENQLWDSESYINSNVISVTIHNLRKKLGKELITNFRGLGYKLEF